MVQFDYSKTSTKTTLPEKKKKKVDYSPSIPIPQGGFSLDKTEPVPDKIDLEADPTPQLVSTAFNEDGSVSVVDKWGKPTYYPDKESYELGERINSRGARSMDVEGDKVFDNKKAEVKARNIKKVEGMIQPRQELQPDVDTSLTGSIGDIGANILTKAGTGAAGGALAGVVTGGALSAPGAAAGAAGGVIYGLGTSIQEMKEDAIQNTKVQYKVLTTSESNLKLIVSSVNKGQLDPVEGLRLYNRELAAIDQAEANLKKLGERDWSKSKDELVAIESFNRFGRQQLNRMMAEAVVAPGTTNVSSESAFPTEQPTTE